MSNELINCNICPNACLKDDLKCGRGRVLFGMEKDKKPRVECNSNHPMVKKLAKCGRIVEHKSEKMLQHGVDEQRMFDALSEDEQKQLLLLLDKLEEKWKADHAKHHAKHHA